MAFFYVDCHEDKGGAFGDRLQSDVIIEKWKSMLCRYVSLKANLMRVKFIRISRCHWERLSTMRLISLHM